MTRHPPQRQTHRERKKKEERERERQRERERLNKLTDGVMKGERFLDFLQGLRQLLSSCICSATLAWSCMGIEGVLYWFVQANCDEKGGTRPGGTRS